MIDILYIEHNKYKYKLPVSKESGGQIACLYPRKNAAIGPVEFFTHKH